MATLIRMIDRLSSMAATLAAAIVVYMVAHIGLEIVMRSVFNTSTFVTEEFVGFAVAAASFLALGEALRKERLIRIGLLVSRLPRMGRIISFLLIAVIGWATIGFLASYIWRTLVRDFTRGTLSTSIAEVPIWIPTSFVFAGLVIFLLQLCAEVLRTLTPGSTSPRHPEV